MDKASAYEYCRHAQVAIIAAGCPDEWLRPYSLAKTWCLEHIRDGTAYVSVAVDKEHGELSYLLLYSKSSGRPPPIISMHGIVLDPNAKTRRTFLDVTHSIEIFCRSRSMFLQSRGLRLWPMLQPVLHLEKCLELDS